MIFTTPIKQQIYYEWQGNLKSNKTIVFLNGLTQSTLAWFFVVPYFKENYKILLLDFVFQGQSSKDGEWKNFDEHAKDLNELLIHEKVEELTVCGLSYGSLIAQHFSILYPQKTKRLILMATFAHKTPYYEAIELSWWRALELGGYNLMLDIMLPSVLSEGYFSKPVIPIELMKESRKDLNQNAEAIFKLMRATKERKDFRNDLQKINCPTLIIQGEKDLLLPVHLASEVHKNIANSKLIIIAKAGHTLNLEHVEEVCNEILSFLN